MKGMSCLSSCYQCRFARRCSVMRGQRTKLHCRANGVLSRPPRMETHLPQECLEKLTLVFSADTVSIMGAPPNPIHD